MLNLLREESWMYRPGSGRGSYFPADLWEGPIVLFHEAIIPAHRVQEFFACETRWPLRNDQPV